MLSFPACGGSGSPSVSLSTSSASIVNGNLDTTHDGVVGLVWNDIVYCSGTLLTQRTVLTAGHCLREMEKEGVTLNQIRVYAGPSYGAGSRLIPIAKAAVHPDYGWIVVDGIPVVINDLAVLTLDGIVYATPVPWSHQDPAALVGETVEAVGFGVSIASPPGGGNTRRRIQQTVTAIDEHFVSFEGNNGSICSGDSGGAIIASLEDGDHLVGVISWGRTADCLEGGGAQRLDAAACFIATESGAAPPIAVSMSLPASALMRSGGFDVTVTAESQAEVNTVELFVDSVSVGASPSPATFHVAPLDPLPHSFAAKASGSQCAYGETTTEVAAATVDECKAGVGGAPLPVSVAIHLPSDDAMHSVAFHVTVQAESRIEVQEVDLYLDGTLVGTSSSPFSFQLDALDSDHHTLVAKASAGECAYGEATLEIEARPDNKDPGGCSAAGENPIHATFLALGIAALWLVRRRDHDIGALDRWRPRCNE